MIRRLLLSYLLIIAVTVVLLSLTIQNAAAQTAEASPALAERVPAVLANYFALHNSWEGVQAHLEEASQLTGLSLTLVDSQNQIIAATLPDWLNQTTSAASHPGLAVPVKANSTSAALGTVYLSGTLAFPSASSADLTPGLLGVGLAVGLLAMGLGLWLTRSISRPLLDLSRAAGRIGQGDYSVRVQRRGQDEMATLAQAFNQMADGVSRVERLRRELVANVSHDLRTPLTVIRGYLEGLRSNQIADRRTAERAFEAMYTEVNCLLRLVNSLHQVTTLDAKAAELEHRPLSLAELSRDTLARLNPLIEAKGVALVNCIVADLPLVTGDVTRLGQVLFNLLDNALRHTPVGGTITLNAGQINSQLWLTVQDNGEGITSHALPHVFERFYRADPVRSRAEGGAGLGLAIVREIVEAHGGKVVAESNGLPGQGSTFTLYLPL